MQLVQVKAVRYCVICGQKKNRVGALAAHFIWPQLILITCYKLLIAQASLALWERGLHQSHMQLRTFLLVYTINKAIEILAAVSWENFTLVHLLDGWKVH